MYGGNKKKNDRLILCSTAAMERLYTLSQYFVFSLCPLYLSGEIFKT